MGKLTITAETLPDGTMSYEAEARDLSATAHLKVISSVVGDLANALRAGGQPEPVIAYKIMKAVAERLRQKPDEGYEATVVRVVMPGEGK